MFAPPDSSVARLPCGGCSPGLYLPVSAPCAIGDQTIWPRPSSSQVGTTSASITRHSMLYCGWFEISGTCSSSASDFAARVSSARGAVPPRARPPPPPPLGDADVERLSGAYDVGEREHRLLERRHVVEPMRLVEVDVVGLQTLQ